MRNKIIPLKPSQTLLAKVEVKVSYSCEQPPTKEDVTVTGLEQFAFILGHKYEMDADVEDFEEAPCQMEGCERPILYRFNVRIGVRDSIGIGFGIGSWGAFVAGWRSETTEDVFPCETDCICCKLGPIAQEPKPQQQSIRERPMLGGIVAALGLVATGYGTICGLRELDLITRREVAIWLLSAGGGALAFSVYLAYVRMALGYSRMQHSKMKSLSEKADKVKDETKIKPL